MIKRFVFEMSVGTIGIICVLIFGEKGMAALALMALLPLVIRYTKKKRKYDEREFQLFYRIGNYTMGILIFVIVLIDQLMRSGVNLISIWMPLSIGFFFLFHGLIGIIVLSKN